MKKKLILTSILSIIMCFSLIAGATFALFTSESKVNIAVTSGTVKVDAVPTIVTAETSLFAGTANINEQEVVIDKMLANDYVTIDVLVDNKSDVEVKYNTQIQILDQNVLRDELEITVNNEILDEELTSAWKKLSVGQDGESIKIVIKLIDVESGNLSNGGVSCRLAITVNAVQGNARTLDTWNGTADTTWFDAQNVETSYTLSTAEQVAGLANLANAGETFENSTITLDSDLDLAGIEWTPVATGTRSGCGVSTTNAFAGVFDGNGATIKNISFANVSNAKDGAGLFGVVTGTIKNLKIESTVINSGSDSAALVASMVIGGTVSGITTSADCVVNAVEGGGIVGRMFASGTITDCVNNANVTMSSNGAGGIIGKAYYTRVGQEMNIVNCVNYGEITSIYSAGGIAGLSCGNVTNCKNYGDVICTGNSAGGIAGEQNYYGVVSGCENNGAVSSKGLAGGIVGYVRNAREDASTNAGDYQLIDTIEIKNNVNNAKVAVIHYKDSATGAGGIVGYADNDFRITDNNNTCADISNANSAYQNGDVGHYSTNTAHGSVFVVENNTSVALQ